MDNTRKIKDIYGILFNLEEISEENKCQMNEWYNDLINKTYKQIDLFDITRMIIQKMFLEIAISKAIIFIQENPFCGQRYEGELLELLYKMDMSYLEKYRSLLKEILLKALLQNRTYDWLCEEERKEFEEVINNFLYKISCV